MHPSTTRLIILLTGASFILQSTCSVCPYKAEGCHCSDSSAVCERTSSMPALYTGPDVINCRVLTFKDVNITNIPKGSLPARLHFLMIDGCPITEISDDAFVDSATTLRDLYLTGLKLTQLPSALLRLTSLSTLEIEDTPIGTLNESVLQNISTTLSSLKLINTGLVAWPSAMSYFRVLTELSLDKNPLTDIPDNAFNSFNDSLERLSLVSTGLTHAPKALLSLSTLSSLDLSGNKFDDATEFDSVFPTGSALIWLTINSAGLTRIANFSRLTRLYEIYLNNNNISDPSVGSLPPSVKRLHLDYNSLSLVPTCVAKISRLFALDLRHNKISRIEPNTFPTGLYRLDMTYNQITKINPSDFPSSLSELSLAFNRVMEIQSESFPASLLKLDLSRNQITHVNTSTFPSNLSHLDLSHNKVNEIVPDSFNPGLVYLDLSYNNLSSISNTTFQNLTLLLEINLSNNPISSIQDLAFVDLKSLNKLYLDFTNLTEIPTAIGDLSNMDGSYGTVVSLYNIASIYCPCPKPMKLVNWVKPRTYIPGFCSNGVIIAQYLLNNCSIIETTTRGANASALGFSLLSIYGALFVLLSLHLFDN